jgi:hypothetical protein
MLAPVLYEGYYSFIEEAARLWQKAFSWTNLEIGFGKSGGGEASRSSNWPKRRA